MGIVFVELDRVSEELVTRLFTRPGAGGGEPAQEESGS
jgi:hypothetical protein